MANHDELHTASESSDADPTDVSHVQLSLKVGVMGGEGSDIPDEYLAKASQLGEAIAAAGCIVVTGACPGLPMAAARGAKGASGLVTGDRGLQRKGAGPSRGDGHANGTWPNCWDAYRA